MPRHPALAAGRAAVITGGASGIGLAAAKRFAALGMKICLADLNQEVLDRAAQQLSGATVVTVPTDVSRLEAGSGYWASIFGASSTASTPSPRQ